MILFLLSNMIFRQAETTSIPASAQVHTAEVFRSGLEPVCNVFILHLGDLLFSPHPGGHKVFRIKGTFVVGVFLEEIETEPCRENTILIGAVF